MKIAHSVFSVASNSGGIGPVVQGLTSALKANADIDPVTYVPTNGASDDYVGDLVKFNCWGPAQHCISPELVTRLANDKIDLIHCHGIWTFLARTNLAWRKSGNPCVISPHGMTMPAAMQYSRWKKNLVWPWLEKPNLEKANCLHALSSVEAASIRALGIKTPVVLIGNGIDLPGKASNQVANAARNDGVRTMLYLGRIHPIKGLDKLIGAWQSQANDAKAKMWRLQIVGWGPDDYVRKIKNQIADDESVVFTGPLFGDQKHEAMNRANAFVLPSSSEAFPIALMEAWSHGLPAVATKTCNVLGETGESTSLFVEDSQQAIQAGIQQTVELSDEQRQTMGDRARAIVDADYSWPTIAKKFNSVYRWLLGDGDDPTDLMFD